MPAAEPRAIPPHPIMPDLYRDNAEKAEWLRRIFDDTAADYDRIESWLSLGSGRWYRRQALRRASLAPGMSVADVACGTGLLAREALTLVGPTGSITGIDPSQGMRDRAAQQLGITTLHGFADSLPLPDRSFDFLSMGYALRHVADAAAAFAEFRRVLKPGGRLCILEITRPAGPIRRALLRIYMQVICTVALVCGRRQPRTGELWRYYWRTIDQCISPDQVLAALRAAGFTDVRRRVELGVFSEYTATAL